jgi:hypothetical protein
MQVSWEHFPYFYQHRCKSAEGEFWCGNKRQRVLITRLIETQTELVAFGAETKDKCIC